MRIANQPSGPRFTLDRRQALAGMTLLGAASGSAPLFASRAEAAAAPDWVWQPMRWMQINFTEDDPGRFDPGMWLDFMRRSKVQGVCLGAGGILAFYPTKVPFHQRSKYLGDLDIFGDMAKACKAMGMRVLARVDPSVMRADALAAHPEWVARSATGEPRKHPADPSLYLTCPNGAVSFDWLPQIIREIAATYPVDGIFGNRWSGGLVGVCYCETCKTEFRAASGLALPVTAFNRQDPAARAYGAWSDEKRFAQMRCYTDAIRAINPEGLFAPGSSWQRLDPKRLRETFRAIYADQQGRPASVPIWAAGRGAKEAACVMQGGPIAGSFNVAQDSFKDSVQSIDETLTFMHDGIAQGYRPWLIKFKAELFDKRWMSAIEAAYNWHSRHERYFRNTANLASVAMMQSVQTLSNFRSGTTPSLPPVSAMTAGGNDAAVNGFYQALVEARVPFALVDDRELEQAVIGKYKVLVLPNIACLSDSQCARLRDYVANGGALVATGETSLYDEQGADRPNFGLAELFGCDFAGKLDRKVDNAYISVDGAHPLTTGLTDAGRIVAGTSLVQIAPREGDTQVPLHLIKSYPALPAEAVYPREPTTNLPMAFARSFGKGRVVYFPFNIDAAFWEHGAEDHLTLLRNAVAWAGGGSPPLSVEGAGLIDVSYWRQEDSLTAHLVNLNNPSAMKGYIRETVPVGPFTVSLEIPVGAKVRSVRLLEADRAAKVRRASGRLWVDVPHVQRHEIIAIDLG
ncbi:MAG: beta-galactosidase trimerization domain-containing protein [Novosphingobium sp.]